MIKDLSLESIDWKHKDVARIFEYFGAKLAEAREDIQRLELENAQLKEQLARGHTVPDIQRHDTHTKLDRTSMDQAIQSILGKIPCNIVRSERRNTSEIQVHQDGLTVRVPAQLADQEILKMLKRKNRWISEKYTEFQTESEEKKHYKTRHDTSYIAMRINELAPQIGVKVNRVIIKHLKTRWGSASPGGIITINSRLFKAPKHVLDYVIIHELCHIHVPDHSSAFWNLVVTHMPNYTKSIEWLKQHGRFI